jgi:signal peptidase II
VKATRFLILGLLILLADQYTKLLAVEHLRLGAPIQVLDGYFNFTLVYNKGAAFGMFSSWPDLYRRFALASVSLLAIIVVFRFVLHEAKGDSWSLKALAAVLAGAIGNIIDRFRLDAVVDFLDFYVGDYHWPAFNIADSAICIGVTLLVLRMVINPRHAGR